MRRNSQNILPGPPARFSHSANWRAQQTRKAAPTPTPPPCRRALIGPDRGQVRWPNRPVDDDGVEESAPDTNGSAATAVIARLLRDAHTSGPGIQPGAIPAPSKVPPARPTPARPDPAVG